VAAAAGYDGPGPNPLVRPAEALGEGLAAPKLVELGLPVVSHAPVLSRPRYDKARSGRTSRFVLVDWPGCEA